MVEAAVVLELVAATSITWGAMFRLLVTMVGSTMDTIVDDWGVGGCLNAFIDACGICACGR